MDSSVMQETADWQPSTASRAEGGASRAAKAIELLFYAYLAYALLSGVFGFAVVGLGRVWWTVLAVLALIEPDLSSRVASHRTGLILICLIVTFHVVTQVLVYGVSIRAWGVYQYIDWLGLAIVVGRLIRTPGFLWRLSWVLVVLMVVLWATSHPNQPHAQLLRARAVGSGIDNPDDFGTWSGFCALLLFVQFLSQGRWVLKILSLLGSLVSLGALAATVSRGPLIAFAVGAILALIDPGVRRRGILLVALLAMAVVLYAFWSGAADAAASDFLARAHDSSRLPVWLAAIDVAAKHPILGVGVTGATYPDPRTPGNILTPHNGVLFTWVASGALPALLLVVLWGMSFRNALGKKLHPSTRPCALALLAYAFLSSMTLNFAHTSLCVTVPLILALTGESWRWRDYRPRPSLQT